MSETLYKVLDADGQAFHGGHGAWSLPHDGDPGDWMPPIADIKLCKRGYHLCRPDDLVRWLGPIICVAEYRGKRVDGDDKIVVAEARLLRQCVGWNERTVRLFACDCAEHVLPLFERWWPNDTRPRNCILLARRYADGQTTRQELAAAWAAAGDAARAAAWAAAGDAARAAARAAAGDAARAAAGDAELEWQTTTLLQYVEGTP